MATRNGLLSAVEVDESVTASLGDVAWPVIGWVTEDSPLEAARMTMDEDARALTVTAYLPGFDPTRTEVLVQGAALLVRAVTEGGQILERSFQMSAVIDPDAIHATQRGEFLTVTAPKRRAEPRKVTVTLEPEE
ncbi:MAG: Hsp20/alpha crystallin family protein [Myxococcota bacterium]